MTCRSINRFSIDTLCRSHGGTKIDQEKRWLFGKYKVKEKVSFGLDGSPPWVDFILSPTGKHGFRITNNRPAKKIVERPMNDRVIL